MTQEYTQEDSNVPGGIVKQRWRPVLNTTSEWVPGHACMQIVQADVVERQLVWHIGKPNRDAENQQNSSMLMFNSGNAIPPYNSQYKQGYGRGTQDWPAAGMIDMSVDPGGGIANVPGTPGECWGPKEDEWFLYRNRAAFSYQCLDGTFKPPTSGAGQSYRRMIVAPGVDVFFGASYQLGTLNEGNIAANVQPENKIGWNYLASPLEGFWSPITQGTSPFHLAFTGLQDSEWMQANPGGGWPQFPISAMYEWSFHCSATGYAPTQGAAIRIDAYLDDEQLDPYVIRTVNIEIDNYGNQIMWTCENMAMNGRLEAEQGQVLNFRNHAEFPINVLAGFCHVKRIRGGPIVGTHS